MTLGAAGFASNEQAGAARKVECGRFALLSPTGQEGNADLLFGAAWGGTKDKGQLRWTRVEGGPNKEETGISTRPL